MPKKEPQPHEPTTNKNSNRQRLDTSVYIDASILDASVWEGWRVTEKQIITDQERIQHLEDKIKRQRADLSRLYRERDDYVESLKKDLAHRELMADEWHRLFAETRTKYRKVKELWRKSEARYNGLVEKLVEKGIIQE